MTLKEVLGKKNQIYVKEFQRIVLPHSASMDMIVGGCFYVDGRLVSLDGGEYSLDAEVLEHKWLGKDELKVVIKGDS